MWTTALIEHLDTGWDLASAIREVLPPVMPGRIEAATDVLMVAISAPDPALPSGSQQPVRVGPTELRMGKSTLSITDSAGVLSVIVEADGNPLGRGRFPLPEFVAQTLALRTRGDSAAEIRWLRRHLCR